MDISSYAGTILFAGLLMLGAACAVFVANRHVSGQRLALERERKRLRSEIDNEEALLVAMQQLSHAQKLDSVGQLAAGIAHEINTPIQFIGDNVRFLKETFVELIGLLEIYKGLLHAAREGTLDQPAIRDAVTATRKVELAYLLKEIPIAIDQTLEGVGRVATLVGAMKEFSHPGTVNKVPLDLNHLIQSTITVARNEWKYVAELETKLDPSLPKILCQPGEFNQAILNLIVNAAQAIAEKNRDTTDLGNITVTTRKLDKDVEIRVRDTGAGIPANVQTRIFDPFFTTKEIGKGTGQGLAITRSVIVDKHSGSIDFETIEGEGTTFIIRLPHDSMGSKAEAMVA
jgi:signal transduction histidine kinase